MAWSIRYAESEQEAIIVCSSRAERYGTHSAALMRSIDRKLHAILDDCSDPLYRLIADDEAWVHTVVRNLVHI